MNSVNEIALKEFIYSIERNGTNVVAGKSARNNAIRWLSQKFALLLAPVCSPHIHNSLTVRLLNSRARAFGGCKQHLCDAAASTFARMWFVRLQQRRRLR